LPPIKSISLFDNNDHGGPNKKNSVIKFFDNNELNKNQKYSEKPFTFDNEYLPQYPNGPSYIIDILQNVKSTKKIHKKEYLVPNAMFALSCGLFYEGNLEFGKMHGKGTLMLKPVDTSNKKSLEVQRNILYEGNFFQNQVDGKGMLNFQNGQKYIGNFKNGKAHGNGTILDIKGNIIITGIWLEGKYYT
jgi:hypothetical protein